ncbi:MAG TPA: hypothetical protein VK024_02735 [Actinomycetaceae bacterium]|nr:hypothetical protein [Actinomycetaceae bacterium]
MLVVLATGAGGESEPAEHRWVVDTTAPVVHIVAGPSDSTATTALIEFQVKDPDAPDGSPPLAVTCALDGATPVACDGGVFSLTGLTAGAHEVVVTATDGAGNAGSATHRWVVEAGEGPTPTPTSSPTPTPTPDPSPAPTSGPSPAPTADPTPAGPPAPGAQPPPDGLPASGAPVGGLLALSALVLASGLLILRAVRPVT